MSLLARLTGAVALASAVLIPAIAMAAEPNDLEQSIIDATAVMVVAERRCADLKADVGSLDILRRHFGLPGDFFNIVDGPWKLQARAALIRETDAFNEDLDSCAKALALYGHQEGPVPPVIRKR